MSAERVQELRERIEEAFPAVATLRASEMLLEPYRTSADAIAMAVDFAGKSWREVSMRELDRHRELYWALSGAAYRAYLPAILSACLAEDASIAGEIGGHLLDGLKQWPRMSAARVAGTSERLGALDGEQREVVREVLVYLCERWQMARASEVLETWEAARSQ